MPKKDLDEKDTDLLKKVTMVAAAVQVDRMPVFAVDVSFLNLIGADFNDLSIVLDQ